MSLHTLERPSIPSPCNLSNPSFQHVVLQIWNSLLSTFRTPSCTSHQPLLSSEQFHRLPLVPHRWTDFLDFGFAPFKGLAPFIFCSADWLWLHSARCCHGRR